MITLTTLPLGMVQPGDRIERKRWDPVLNRVTTYWDAVTEVGHSVTQVHESFHPVATLNGADGFLMSADANHKLLVQIEVAE